MTPSDELQKIAQKASEWENKFKALNDTYSQTNSALEEANKRYSQLEKDIKVRERNNKILASFPEKMKMDKSDALLIVNNSLEFEETDEGLIVKRDGRQILNKLGEPESIENAIASFVETKGWTKASGAGGTDRKPDSGLPNGLSADEAVQFITQKGVDPMSTEGSKMFIELTK